MSTHVTINDAELQRKIGKLAILSGKGMEDAVRQVASRFVKSAVRNTPPMILRISPGQAKREWTARVTANYTKMPVVNGQRLTPAEMKRILARTRSRRVECSSGATENQAPRLGEAPFRRGLVHHSPKQ